MDCGELRELEAVEVLGEVGEEFAFLGVVAGQVYVLVFENAGGVVGEFVFDIF